jgi:hypothetical protein
MISVIMPTVPGREEIYARCRDAYLEHGCGPHRLEFITEHDHPAVGYGWQAGAEKATGDFLHFTNDDCEPHPGWWEPAVEAVQRGFIPAPQVYGPEGDPQAPPQWGVVSPDWTPLPPQNAAVIPFLSRAQWEKVQPLALIHYYADDWITYRARVAGWPCMLRTGYSFIHHWAQVRRGAGMTQDERMAHDRRLYEQAVQMCEAGQWTQPWPRGGIG